MSKEISKSPEMLKKEARIEVLKKSLKKERTTLKRLKTRLANTKQEITDIQRTISSAYLRMMEKMTQLKEEIVASLKRLKKMKGISKLDKQQMEMFIDDLEEVTQGESYEEYNEYKRKMEEEDFDFDEQTRAKMRDMFQEFHVKPNEKEQRNIRKVFIKLSTNFHPDKARNPKEQEEYHSLMQQINEAYQANDIEKLLELEQVYLGGETIDLTTKAVTVDLLQQVIDRLERDLDFIKNQITRTSAEIKDLRASDLGQMLTDMNRAEKEGMGMDSMTADMDESVEKLEELRDTFTACEKQKSMEPMHEMVSQNMMEANPFADFDDDADPLDMLDELMEMMGNQFEKEPVKKPKFKVGSSVVVSKNVAHQAVIGINMKGWEGRVVEVYKSFGQILYRVYFDSLTIQGMDEELIDLFIEEEVDFGYYEFSVSDLKKSKPRDTAEAARRIQRTLLHSKQWEYLEEEEEALMKSILLRFPEKSDIENWEFWFGNNLEFPFKGTHTGLYNQRNGQKVEVLGLHSWNEDVGQLVLVKRGKMIADHPLIDIDTRGGNEKILDLFREYIEETNFE